MSKPTGHIDDHVNQACSDPAHLKSLSDQIVPVMMHLTLEKVQMYREQLEPLLDTLDPGSEEYTYLLIVVSFLNYRKSFFTEVIDTLSEYELQYEAILTPPMFVSVNALAGACYRSLGKAEFALEHFQRNIPFVDIERNDHLYFYSLTLYHIAELYGELREFEAMLDRHTLNLEFFEPDDQPDFYFRTLNGVGRAYRGMQKYDVALKHLLDVEEKSVNKANIPFRARNLHDLGSIYAEINMVDESLKYFEKALHLRHEHQLTNAAISTTMEMGRILIEDNRLHDAIYLLKMALAEAEHFGVKKKQSQICRLLSEAYEKDQALKDALEYYKKFHDLKEEVDNVDYTRAENQRVREINTVLEEQKKIIEEQNIKIEDSHQAIQVLNENLETLVNERTRQLMERHEQLKHYAFMNAHEVRGPLSTILGLLQIAGEFSTLEEKEELIQMIEQSTSKLDRTIREMHEGLVQFNSIPDAD